MGILYNFRIEEPPKSYTMPKFTPMQMSQEDICKLICISKPSEPALCPTKISLGYTDAQDSLTIRKDELLAMAQIVRSGDFGLAWRLLPNVLPFCKDLHDWHFVSQIEDFDAYYSPTDSMIDGYVYNLTRKRWYEPCFRIEDLIE